MSPEYPSPAHRAAPRRTATPPDRHAGGPRASAGEGSALPTGGAPMPGALACLIEAALASLAAQLRQDLAADRARPSHEEDVGHLGRLGENIGELLRLGHREQPINAAPLDLGDVLMGALPRWQERAPRHTFELALHGDIPTIVADAGRVELAMDRLLAAGVRLLGGGGAVHAGVRPLDDAVRVDVRLRGAAPPAESIPGLFDTVTYGATGPRLGHPNIALDLTLARAIVEAHGGSARAEPPADGGAGVDLSVTFPLVARVAAIAADTAPAPPTGAAPAAPSLTAPLPIERERRVVVVVEADARMARYLKANLEGRDYRALTAGDAAEARRLVDLEAPDLLLVDGGLPGMDGAEDFALLRALLADGGCPIVVLARRPDPLACARALDLGAADWVARPFNTEELLARIRVALRASEAARPPHDAPPITSGELAIDLGQRLVTVAGVAVPLSKTEFKLLRVLAQHPGMVLSHDLLLERVWGPGYADAVEFVWVYVRRLRRKIEPDPARPRYILTVPGVGYRLARG